MEECVKPITWALATWSDLAVTGYALLCVAIGHLWLLFKVVLGPAERLMTRVWERRKARKREALRIQRIGEHRKWMEEHGIDLNKTPRCID
jgi:hypothetical protein